MKTESKENAGTEPAKGRSLWVDAWRRLLKNRMAVVGMIVVILMGLTALMAPAIAPFPATYQQLWVGARRPGYTHPEVLNEMYLEVGKAPEVPGRAKRDGTLRFLVVSRRGDDFRLVLKGPKVRQIVQEIGATKVDRLEVKGESEVLQELKVDGSLGPERRDILLEKKKPLPAALGVTPPGPKRRWVLILRRFTEVTDKPAEV
ncbi:MAG: hypothetical protein ACYS47_19270, partial [Planctomycetota bacterium]